MKWIIEKPHHALVALVFVHIVLVMALTIVFYQKGAFHGVTLFDK